MIAKHATVEAARTAVAVDVDQRHISPVADLRPVRIPQIAPIQRPDLAVAVDVARQDGQVRGPPAGHRVARNVRHAAADRHVISIVVQVSACRACHRPLHVRRAGPANARHSQRSGVAARDRHIANDRGHRFVEADGQHVDRGPRRRLERSADRPHIRVNRPETPVHVRTAEAVILYRRGDGVDGYHPPGRLVRLGVARGGLACNDRVIAVDQIVRPGGRNRGRRPIGGLTADLHAAGVEPDGGAGNGLANVELQRLGARAVVQHRPVVAAYSGVTDGRQDRLSRLWRRRIDLEVPNRRGAGPSAAVLGRHVDRVQAVIQRPDLPRPLRVAPMGPTAPCRAQPSAGEEFIAVDVDPALGVAGRVAGDGQRRGVHRRRTAHVVGQTADGKHHRVRAVNLAVEQTVQRGDLLDGPRHQVVSQDPQLSPAHRRAEDSAVQPPGVVRPVDLARLVALRQAQVSQAA